MKLKKSAIAVSVATFALILSSLTPANAAWQDSLVTKGTLTNCIDVEYPPMEYFSNGTSGKIIGFDADGSTALAKALGLKIKLLNTSFDGLIPALNAGRCDIVWTALYLSNKRLAVADGVPYLQTGPGLVVKKGNPLKIQNLTSDLCGKKMAVQAASANEGLLKEQSIACVDIGAKAIKISSYPKVAETVAALLNGKVDGIVETDVACGDIATKSKGKLSVASGAFPGDIQFAVYLNKNSPLTAQVKAGIKKIIANGTLGKVAKNYNLDPGKLTTVAGEPI